MLDAKDLLALRDHEVAVRDYRAALEHERDRLSIPFKPQIERLSEELILSERASCRTSPPITIAALVQGPDHKEVATIVSEIQRDLLEWKLANSPPQPFETVQSLAEHIEEVFAHIQIRAFVHRFNKKANQPGNVLQRHDEAYTLDAYNTARGRALSLVALVPTIASELPSQPNPVAGLQDILCWCKQISHRIATPTEAPPPPAKVTEAARQSRTEKAKERRKSVILLLHALAEEGLWGMTATKLAEGDNAHRSKLYRDLEHPSVKPAWDKYKRDSVGKKPAPWGDR